MRTFVAFFIAGNAGLSAVIHSVWNRDIGVGDCLHLVDYQLAKSVNAVTVILFAVVYLQIITLAVPLFT